MSLKIIGTGKGFPERNVTNSELAEFLDTSDEWILSRTGIKSRYVCTHETLTDLASDAAKQALENAKLKPSDIDLIVCSTMGGDFRTPSLACCLLERIGTKCPAFDINAACTGFIYALEIASSFLSTGRAKNILIVCADLMSALVDWTDRNTCVLFGDGAGACVVTTGGALKYINTSANADMAILNLPSGTGNSPFVSNKKTNGFLHMQGQEVFKFAVSVVESEMKQATQILKITPDQVDWFILHQANKRIIDFARTKLRQPETKFPINIERYGNLSSASIPILLCEMVEDGKIKSGATLFITAFGAGLTAGSCVMIWE